MELKPSLKARQQLSLSPRLYQSLKVLRLSAADVMDLIQKELDDNPALEIPEPSDFDIEAADQAGSQAVEVELWRDLAASGRSEASPARRDPLRPGSHTAATDLAQSPVTLSDHLTLQLNLKNLPAPLTRDALAIIASLDEDGYLRDPLEEVAATVNRPLSELEEALSIVQTFDPAGISARSLEECLIIQLRQLKSGELPQRIVRECLPLVAKDDVKKIARKLGAPVSRVTPALALIRSLNPAPGSLFDSSPPATVVIPDVFVRVQGGRIRILANREMIPSLHVSELYSNIAENAAAQGDGEGPAADEDTVKYIKTKIREASRLIRDVDQRLATVTKVAKAIADSQPDFFEKGPAYLRPLTLDDIAARLEVHPSTVSRAILGKYMSTAFGVFEFRYFFSAGYTACQATVSGLAATAVKQRLKKIIEDEDRRRPLSDQKLTDLLKKDGIPISRRTVAKYREEMAIAPSWDRKKK